MIEVLYHLVSLFVGNHALVCAFHLIQENDVDIRLCALAEACWHDESVEEVFVVVDTIELIVCS